MSFLAPGAMQLSPGTIAWPMVPWHILDILRDTVNSLQEQMQAKLKAKQQPAVKKAVDKKGKPGKIAQ